MQPELAVMVVRPLLSCNIWPVSLTFVLWKYLLLHCITVVPSSAMIVNTFLTDGLKTLREFITLSWRFSGTLSLVSKVNVTVWNSEQPFPWDEGEVRCAQAQEHSITLNTKCSLKSSIGDVKAIGAWCYSQDFCLWAYCRLYLSCSAMQWALVLLCNTSIANNIFTERISAALTAPPTSACTALLSAGQVNHDPSELTRPEPSTDEALHSQFPPSSPHLLPGCSCPPPQDCCGSNGLRAFLATSWSVPERRMRNWSLLTVFRKVRMVLRNRFSVFFRAQRTSHVSGKHQGWKLL